MLSWKISKNVVAELYYHNQNIINPWGIETSDSSAFFSLEEGIGWRVKKLFEEYNFDEYNYKAHLITKMKEGMWELFVDDTIVENTVIRKAQLITLEDSIFMDFVVRFRFKKEFIEFAEIAGKRLYHNDSNIYYQYPVDNVYLQGKGFGIVISVIDKVVPEKMEPTMYVRDSKDEWVIHARMIPKNWDKEVIKICTKWAGTRSLPQFISKPLLSFKSIRKSLWYRGEKAPYKSRIIQKLLNPSAFGMVFIPKNTKIMWYLKLEIK